MEHTVYPPDPGVLWWRSLSDADRREAIRRGAVAGTEDLPPELRALGQEMLEANREAIAGRRSALGLD